MTCAQELPLQPRSACGADDEERVLGQGAHESGRRRVFDGAALERGRMQTEKIQALDGLGLLRS